MAFEGNVDGLDAVGQQRGGLQEGLAAGLAEFRVLRAEWVGIILGRAVIAAGTQQMPRGAVAVILVQAVDGHAHQLVSHLAEGGRPRIGVAFGNLPAGRENLARRPTAGICRAQHAHQLKIHLCRCKAAYPSRRAFHSRHCRLHQESIIYGKLRRSYTSAIRPRQEFGVRASSE